jgi:hypothetical protein
MLLSLLFCVLIFNLSNASLITKVDPEFSKNINIITKVDPEISQNNSSLNLLNNQKMKKYELVHFVSSLNKMSHPPIVFLESNFIKPDSFLNNLNRILNEDYDYDPVDSYFNSINELLEDFSEFSKSFCLDVMYSLKKHGGFLLKEEEEEEEEKPLVEKEKSNVERGGAFLFAAAAAIMSGDIVAPVSVFLNDETAAKVIPSKPLDDDFSYSKVYCINTFSLFFAFTSDKQRDNQQNDNRDDNQQNDNRDDNQQSSVTIYGDKIPYEYFIKHISLLKERIKAIDSDNDNDTDRSVFLENIAEQLEALKIVVSKLDQLVVFELHGKLTNMIELGASFPKIQKYISNKVSELVDLKQDLLAKDFPISNAEVSKLARLNAVKRDLERIKHADQMINVKQASDQRVTKNVLQNELNENEFATWSKLYVYGPLKRTTSLITRAVISLPEGVAVGGLQGVYDFIGSIFNIFVGSPVTTGLIIVISLAVVYSSVSTIFCSVYNFFSWIFFKGT